ncbi:hypothetical protein T281_04260 [Rhodomicrobium udaipurense JA643]|nr:hypothetical protein T281_04260 [Rhodomicrobium udaipurense JA643]
MKCAVCSIFSGEDCAQDTFNAEMQTAGPRSGTLQRRSNGAFAMTKTSPRLPMIEIVELPVGDGRVT